MTDELPRVRRPHEVDYGELPELTRTLRALGSARRSAGSLQQHFFMPLLDARKRAAEAPDADAALRAFDAPALAQALQRSIDRIVQGWPDDRGAARRALRAELRERTRDYARSLDLLDERAADVLAAPNAERRDAWRAWTVQLAATFDAADRAWISLRAIADALHGAK